MTNERVTRIMQKLGTLYPYARAELNFSNPYETLVATILSAQCTDKRVNQVTEKLFKECPDVYDMVKLSESELEERIRECGLYRMKAQHIIEACRAIIERFDGEVPSTRAELMSLPGVGQKTAGVVLMAAFGADEIPVDTHVFRLSKRIGFAKNASAPEQAEVRLRELIPAGERGHMHHLLIWHGRRCCKALKPECERCPLNDGLCDYYMENK